MNDTEVWPLLVGLRDSLAREATRSGIAVENLAVYPGQESALDTACESQAWVLATSVFPSQTFPNVATTPQAACASSLAVAVQVGIVRCAPVPRQISRGDYVAPPLTEQHEAARVQMADMALIRRAILASTYSDLVLGTYLPVGPMGGLVGGYWTATLGR